MMASTHPRIAEIAERLFTFIENEPKTPTQIDRDELMRIHGSIKVMLDEDQWTKHDLADLSFLRVASTQAANRQEEFYEKNGNKWAPMTKEQLLALGPEARIAEVLRTFTDGPNHDWAQRDLPNIKKGLEAERRRFVTMADMATYTGSEMSGPQCQYAGNKCKVWMGWAMSQFGLEHKLTGY